MMRTIILSASLAALLAMSSCGSEDPAASAPEVERHSYTVRGEVVQLPSATGDFTVKHEAIPEFDNLDGTRGMNVMAMPFWPPQGVGEDDPRVALRVGGFSLDGIEVGDKVRVTFEVLVKDAGDGFDGWYATIVEELPADTRLDFTPLPGD